MLATLSFFNCRNDETRNCFDTKQLYIEFSPPFTFSEEDTLYIDGLKFSHTYYLDSIKKGNFLPKEQLIILEMENKQAKEKITSVGIGRTLARKLKNTRDYKILNGPELITTGKLKIERLDKKTINICSTPNYLAKLKAVNP